jgi:adenylate kinase
LNRYSYSAPDFNPAAASASPAQQTKMNIVLIGPYGAGKGTQAGKLAAKFDLFHISTGDLFREHLRNGTELGQLIQKYLDAGDLVPDSVATATMEEWLRVCPSNEGILFDGFPRTRQQAKFLEEIFIDIRRSLDAVIYLKASDKVVIQRLSDRLICQQCQVPFHNVFNPFVQCPSGKCKGEHLTQRDEDSPEKVRVRLELFHQETEPLVKYYEDLEKLIVIDADKPIDQVQQSLIHALQNKIKNR